jgi:hypothetical protein
MWSELHYGKLLLGDSQESEPIELAEEVRVGNGSYVFITTNFLTFCDIEE